MSTYPPRICGIGTFSRDLRDALLGADGVSAIDIAAIVRDEVVEGPGEVVTRIRQDQRGDYAAAARVLERRGDDVVIIQHEYGIFGGDDGAHILSLAAGVRQPIVLTLHTVLSAPSVRQAETLRALCGLATLICVFTETARRMIIAARLAPPERVRVVPHGGPPELLPGVRANGPRTDRHVLSTFGLISPGKGIEVAIAAMPAIIARHPTALYVIAGRTHPEVAKLHGEEYRISLERLTRDLGLTEHVVFDDRFLELDDLAEMLADTTIYLTPYRSREQIVSGALTFAVVAGCATVSTPYYYAEDLLGSGAGVLVDFDDPAALASAVTSLLDDPDRLQRTRAEARTVGARLAWPEVGRQTADVLSEAIALGPPSAPRLALAATLPRARLSHLLTMVDDVGIIQHADGAVPQRGSGYCTDDLARLAIVALGLARTTGAESHHRMLARSLGFLRHAWSSEARGMRNFMSYDRRWLDAPHAGDHLGRAAWALGEVIAASTGDAVRRPSVELLQEMLTALLELRWPRSIAFATIGLARAGDDELGDAATDVLRTLAGRLVDLQRANATEAWYWSEDALTYDNARLPQALIAAGARLGDADLISEGVRALKWYARECNIDGEWLQLVGHHGRRRGQPRPGDGDEQPLDAAALVEAEVEAFVVTGDPACGRDAVRAFEWFLGRNRLRLSVYDFATGGCHDGLGATAVNGNEGAESTLAYLQALHALDAAGLQVTLPG
ncbi:glycosyltransferase [Solirubrobacter soli]|uniref:glycosyltransferase n=1 Tax=Solirubrobacter soli TaxID=363832 RepID=UPI00041FD83B|nr:glycosyltransferase [Solirubrobacter soli]